MIEKPIAMNLDEARELLEMAETQKRVLSVFHNRRWDADFLAVKSAITSGVFGKIINVESRLGQWASCVGPAAKEYRPNWRNEDEFGGGGLLDWGSPFHRSTVAVNAARAAIQVFAQLRHNVWSKDCDDFARVCIDFDNGAGGVGGDQHDDDAAAAALAYRWTAGSAESPHSPSFDVARWAEIEFKRWWRTAVDGCQREKRG